MVLRNSLVRNRYLRYKKFKNINKKKIPFLVFKNRLSKELESLVLIYLRQNLSSQGSNFLDLEKSSQNILKLPNITPGGVIMPKIETQLIYNAIVQICLEGISEISDKLYEITPITIRFKSGSSKSLSRPYETSKLHSDAWVGMFGDGIISIAVMGDVANNGVEFFMPKLITKDYFGKLNDYNQGLTKFKGLKKIGNLKENHIHLFDNIVLHRSKSKKKGLPRISIDFAYKLKPNIDKNFFSPDLKRYNFRKTSIYNSIGIRSYYISNEYIKDTKKRIKKNLKFKKDEIIKI